MHFSYQIRSGARVMLCLGLLALVGTGCMSIDIKSLLTPSLKERVVEPARTRNKILLLDIRGVIMSGEAEGPFSVVTRCTPEGVKAELALAERDKEIKAVVLRIDSPGGDVTASDVIHHEISAFKERTGIPVYASILGLGASGGYYIACAADRIFVHPTTVTGSIGVIAVFPKLRAMADKIGYDQRVFKSGDMKDMGSVLQEMSPEEAAVVQQIVNTLYEQFLAVVAESRPGIEAEALRGLADGRVFTAPQAVDHRLVDGVAYLPEVLTLVKSAAGVEKAKVVAYVYGGGDDTNIYSGSAARGRQQLLGGLHVDLGALVPETRTGFFYLWSPALP